MLLTMFFIYITEFTQTQAIQNSPHGLDLRTSTAGKCYVWLFNVYMYVHCLKMLFLFWT